MDNSTCTERIAKRYIDLKGELHLVTLSKNGFKSLGMSLVGNKDLSAMSIFVSTLKENYPAAKSGQIHVGDELLEVNGKVLYGRSHLNTTPIFNAITTDSVTLILLRSCESLGKMAVSTPIIAPTHPPFIHKASFETIIPRLPTYSTNSYDFSTDLDSTPPTPSDTIPIYQATSTNFTATNFTATDLIPSIKSPDLTTSISSTFSTPSSISTMSTSPTLSNPAITPTFPSTYITRKSSMPKYTGSIIPISPKTSPRSSILSTTSATLTTQLTLTTIVTVTAESTTIKTPPVIDKEIKENKEEIKREIKDGNKEENKEKMEGKKDMCDSSEQDEHKKKQYPNLKLDLTKTTTQQQPTNKPPLPPTAKQQAVVSDIKGEDDSVFVDNKSDSNNNKVTVCKIITPGLPCLIDVPLEKKALGLKVVGGSDTALRDVYIYEVYEGGMAHKDGRLRVADQIIEINGKPVANKTHQEVVASLRNMATNITFLLLRTPAPELDDEFSLYKNFRKTHLQPCTVLNVELTRRSNKPLGLCVRPVWRDKGVVVNNLMGSANMLGEENSIRVGDEISEVNDVCVQDMPTLQAIIIIKCLIGNLRLKVNRTDVGLIDTSPFSILSPTTPSPSPFSHSFKSHSYRSSKPHLEIKRSKSLMKRAIPSCLTSAAQ